MNYSNYESSDRQEILPLGGLTSVGHCWMHAVPHLDPRLGGISSSVPQLSRALLALDEIRTEIAAFCGPSDAARRNFPSTTEINYWPPQQVRWLHDASLRKSFRSHVKSSDGVHIHGLWQACTRVAARTARLEGKPYVISAHGMLDRWALKQKSLKKRIYAGLTERATLAGAACLHALTMTEVEDYRLFGCRQPIAVIPNGVSLPLELSSSAFMQAFPEARDRRVILFLGRIHRKKGVAQLLDAWMFIAHQHRDALLVFAGPDFDGVRTELESKTQSHNLQNQVLFTGMLEADMKWGALAAAEGFILPSFAEGFSVAVLEAMGAGIPVIISKQCSFPEVSERAAGWEITPTVNEIASSLEDLLFNTPSLNQAMGQRGRDLVLQKYLWRDISSQTASIYRWLNGGPRPTSVKILQEA